jgi:hypothetical protein
MPPKQYVINVDDAGSKLHLNPIFYGDMWCRLDEEHHLSAGGKMEVTRDEAIEFLTGKKPLLFQGRKYTNLEPCKNCSRRNRQSIHWDIP